MLKMLHDKGSSYTDCRYRSWDLLRYQLRGITKHIPFIGCLHLVVASQTQVPDFIDRSAVNVVLHDEFIPREYLPTYNSVTIETFLDKIPGISDEFVYLNDDFFIVKDAKESDFFVDGKPCFNIEVKTLNPNKIGYDRTLIRMNELLHEKLGVPLEFNDGKEIVKVPVHGLMPLSRKMYEDAFRLCEEEISQSLTPVRDCMKNLTPYLFLMLQYYRGNHVNAGLKLKYVQFARFKKEKYETPEREAIRRKFVESNDRDGLRNMPSVYDLWQAEQIVYFLDQSTEAMYSDEYGQLCLNDNERTPEAAFNELSPLIQGLFEERYPEKCKYEL